MSDGTGKTEPPLFRVFGKGTTAEGAEVRRSVNWVFARRAWLRVFADRLEMGDWHIPYSSIEGATLFRLKGLLGGYVLRVVSEGRSFQFGVNPWALGDRQFPFPHRREDTRIRHSVLSIALRVVLLAWLVWAFEVLW